MSDNAETAILAGGCFWGVQELLRHRDGVISTRVGYTGGKNENPIYRKHPGHAEAVEIVFDPERISYGDILEFFFQTGPVVATVENVPYTGSTSILNRQYKWFSSGAVTDPGGVHDLYFVTEWPESLQPEVFVRTLQFITAPEDVTATVTPASPNGTNGWYTSPVTVKVDTGGMPLWTRQVSLDGGQTWTNTNAAGEATVSADGTTAVQYRAIDNETCGAVWSILTVNDPVSATTPALCRGSSAARPTGIPPRGRSRSAARTHTAAWRVSRRARWATACLHRQLFARAVEAQPRPAHRGGDRHR